jgi:DNA-binding CsgD family transcriptional regulator
MAIPRPILLRSGRQRSALHALGDIADAAGSSAGFAETGVLTLTKLIGAELTTLSRCNLREARRAVVGVPSTRVRADERAAFDRHFFEHPLVRYHAIERGAYTHRITDSLPQREFEKTALYNDYYRRIGITHALAVPLRMDDSELASFVLNRQGRDFDDEELALIDAMRRPLARMFAQADTGRAVVPAIDPATTRRHGLTARENEVLGWVAAGKTDRDIAALIGCSPRTVHKHLQRVYAKLGVETRTAAVMRCLDIGKRPEFGLSR